MQPSPHCGNDQKRRQVLWECHPREQHDLGMHRIGDGRDQAGHIIQDDAASQENKERRGHPNQAAHEADRPQAIPKDRAEGGPEEVVPHRVWVKWREAGPGDGPDPQLASEQVLDDLQIEEFVMVPPGPVFQAREAHEGCQHEHARDEERQQSSRHRAGPSLIRRRRRVV